MGQLFVWERAMPRRVLSSTCARWRLASSVAVALTAVALMAWLGLPRVYLPTLVGYNSANFRQRWWRVTTPASIQAQAREKAALPKAVLSQGEPFPPFPVYVISLKNATARQASARQQLEAQWVPFKVFEAVDGTKGIPMDVVRWYLRGARLQEFLGSQPGSKAYRYMACNLSHLRLMHGLIADGAEMQLVFEDDFELHDSGGNFLTRLKEVMQQLPADWEMLWLHHGSKVQAEADRRANTWVGSGVRLTVQNNWAVSLLYRRSFALKVLNDIQIGNKDFDDLVNDICSLGNAACYTADPPLAGVSSKHFASQIIVPQPRGR